MTDRSIKIKRRSVVLVMGILSVIFLIAILVINGMRGDYEVIRTSENGSVDIPMPSNSNFSLLVCVPEARISEIPSGLPMMSPDPDVRVSTVETYRSDIVEAPENAVNSIPIVPPRPVDLPQDFASSRGLSVHQHCSVASQIMVRNGQNFVHDTHVGVENVPVGAFVAAAVSPRDDVSISVLIFLGFVLTVWTTFSVAYRRGFPKLPKFGRFDGIMAFLIALLISFGLSVLFGHISYGVENTFIPNYYEVLAILMTNFLSFMTTFVILCVFRKIFPYKSLEIKENSESGAIHCPDLMEKKGLLHDIDLFVSGAHSPRRDANGVPVQKQSNYPLTAFVCGLILSIVATCVALGAPMPGFSIAELASQFVSTVSIIALASILAGIAEECVFRGIIQSSMEARPGSKFSAVENGIAVFTTSLLFVLVHVPQSAEHLWALIPIGLFSITAGLIKIRSGSIFPAILTHMTYNGLLVLPSILVLLL